MEITCSSHAKTCLIGRENSLSVMGCFSCRNFAASAEKNMPGADQPQLLDSAGFMAPRVHSCMWVTAAICPSQVSLGCWGPACVLWFGTWIMLVAGHASNPGVCLMLHSTFNPGSGSVSDNAAAPYWQRKVKTAAADIRRRQRRSRARGNGKQL